MNLDERLEYYSAAKQEGAEQERAAIVARLRAKAVTRGVSEASSLNQAAALIERGEYKI